MTNCVKHMKPHQNMVGMRPAASIRLTLMVCLGMVCLGMVTWQTAVGDEINESFRDSRLNQMAFGVVGDRALMTPSTDGLRIASTSESQGNTGIAIPQEIHGDFEISAEATLQDFPVPADGYGTGLAILVENAMNHGASLQLVVMPDGAKTIVAHDFEIVNGEHQHHATAFPASSAQMTLKLQRRGDTLYYSTSSDNGATFTELHHADFVATPIRVAQVYGQAGGESNIYDVLLHSLLVTADELVRPGQRPKLADRSRMTSLILISVLLVLGAVITAWVVIRGRRSGQGDAA